MVPFLTSYFKWLNTLPGQDFGAGYWPKIRFGDNIETIYWVYNRTGEPWLLELAKRIHDNMARWDSGVINWHNVNIVAGLPRARRLLPAGAEDRNSSRTPSAITRPSWASTASSPAGDSPGTRIAGRATRTRARASRPAASSSSCTASRCSLKISGDPVWADRCEEMAFNSLPAALTPDLKGLHYLTCANQVQLDTRNKAPAIQNGGTMFSYSPFEVYRCCQHNVSHGWPYYAEELWLATADRGLCASLYAASEVSAKVGDGSRVRMSEETDYPFGETVSFKISSARTRSGSLFICAFPAGARRGG